MSTALTALSALGAILREYVAITVQHFGLRRTARYFRGHPRRQRSDHRDHIEIQSAVPRPVHDAFDQVDIGAYSAMNPLIIDTPSERQLQFTHNVLQSRMRLDDPQALVAPYTRQMMSFLLFNPDPARILMIGLGGGSLPKFCYRRLPHAQITVVEIDARVIAMRDAFHVPADDERFRVVHGDGVQYVAQLDRPIDVILIDAFDETGVAPALANSSFYRDVSQRLTSDGVLVMNLLGNPHSYAAHVECARAAFDNRTLLASVTANDNVLLLAFKPDVTPPAAPHLTLRARYFQSELKLPFRSYLQRLRDGRWIEEK
jgi:spermidine synthase